ncbi:MAG: GtrA family protein [Patescibacteria group bacterium]
MKIVDRLLASQYIQRHPSLPEFFKFAVVGGIGTIVDFGIYALFTRVFLVYYIVARVFSVLIAILNNFLLNKYWTFKKGKSGRGAAESIKFFIVSVANIFLNLGIMYAIIEFTPAEKIFGAYEDFFAIAAAIAIVLFSNYFGNKYWTFKDSGSKDTKSRFNLPKQP